MLDTLTLRDWLGEVTRDPLKEALWLDLLSQLEYVGARKILKSVPFNQVSGEVLLHVSEETLHAQLLKAQAERLGRKGATWESNPLSAAGWEYFQSLDRGISALPAQKEHPYPAVSWAIERRVMEVYPAYATATRDPRIREALQTILVQEKRHGKTFDNALLGAELREQASALEQKLWEELFPKLQAILIVGRSKAPAEPTAALPSPPAPQA